ncbi:MAG: YgiT-type zinc finger protein [Cystobacter sp.]
MIMNGSHGASEYEYGNCPCSGLYEQRSIEVELVVDTKSVVLTGIPQGECPLCGSQVYKMQIMERIETLMASGDRAA